MNHDLQKLKNKVALLITLTGLDQIEGILHIAKKY